MCAFNKSHGLKCQRNEFRDMVLQRSKSEMMVGFYLLNTNKSCGFMDDIQLYCYS